VTSSRTLNDFFEISLHSLQHYSITVSSCSVWNQPKTKLLFLLDIRHSSPAFIFVSPPHPRKQFVTRIHPFWSSRERRESRHSSIPLIHESSTTSYFHSPTIVPSLPSLRHSPRLTIPQIRFRILLEFPLQFELILVPVSAPPPMATR